MVVLTPTWLLICSNCSAESDLSDRSPEVAMHHAERAGWFIDDTRELCAACVCAAGRELADILHPQARDRGGE